MSKKITLSIFLIFFVILASGIYAADAKRELIILNWDDYVDPELISKFEKNYNATITQVFYANDEKRTEQLLQTDGVGYDLILTSGVDLARYIKQDWVVPLELDRAPNLKYVSMKWRQAFPDAEKYAVPYFWGTLGIVYRTDLVKTPITSWKQLFMPAEELRGKIGMIDDTRDVVAMALKSLGFSANSEDKQAISKVREVLRAQRPYVKSYLYISLEEDSSLVNGDIYASMAYSGDALMVAEHDENITYVLPVEGGNIWVDYFVLAKHSKNPDLAYAFLNFINDPENAAKMAEYVYYATPNEAAEELLDKEFLEDPTIYPDQESLKNSEFYTPLSPRAQRLRDSVGVEILR